MSASTSLPNAVYAVWGLTLLIVVVVIVPLAVALLHRTLLAALSIRRYLDEMLQAGVGIAGNTGAISALKDTISVADGMVRTAGDIKGHTGAMAALLSERAARGRAAP